MCAVWQRCNARLRVVGSGMRRCLLGFAMRAPACGPGSEALAGWRTQNVDCSCVSPNFRDRANMPRHRQRTLRWTALIALFCLLFQQAAMATYLCPMRLAAISQTGAQTNEHAHCRSTAVLDRDDPARCQQHCHPVNVSAEHAAPLTVPMVLAAESWAVTVASRSTLAAMDGRYWPIDPHAAAPPLTVQHCTFQI